MTDVTAKLIYSIFDTIRKDVYNVVTTVLGIVAAVAIGSTVDWVKLYHGDHIEIAKCVLAVGSAIQGYLTNKKKETKT